MSAESTEVKQLEMVPSMVPSTPETERGNGLEQPPTKKPKIEQGEDPPEESASIDHTCLFQQKQFELRQHLIKCFASVKAAVSERSEKFQKATKEWRATKQTSEKPCGECIKRDQVEELLQPTDEAMEKAVATLRSEVGKCFGKSPIVSFAGELNIDQINNRNRNEPVKELPETDCHHWQRSHAHKEDFELLAKYATLFIECIRVLDQLEKVFTASPPRVFNPTHYVQIEEVSEKLHSLISQAEEVHQRAPLLWFDRINGHQVYTVVPAPSLDDDLVPQISAATPSCGVPLQPHEFKPTAKPRTPKFQPFHLTILQSLYNSNEASPIHEEDNDSPSLSADCGIQEDTVDDKVWADVQKFIKERDHLIGLKEEAKKGDDVHQEALRYMEEQGLGSSGPSTPAAKLSLASPLGWTDERGQSSVGCHRSMSSPNSLSFFSPKHPALSCHQLSPFSFCGVKSPAKCFGLVAQICQNKSQLLNANLKRQTSPHAPLLKNAKQKIETLGESLQLLQVMMLSKQKQKVEHSYDFLPSGGGKEHDEKDEARPMIAGDAQALQSKMKKMETKLGLWNMLASDITDIDPMNGS